MRALGLIIALLALVAAPAGAAERFAMPEIERELMCPQCGTRLDLSHAPAANQIRAFIEERRAAGATKEQVKDELVAQFGSSILVDTPRRGIGLVAWVGPLLVVFVGSVIAALAVRAWRRRATADPPAQAPPLDATIERAIDEELARLDR